MALTKFNKDVPLDDMQHLMCQAHGCPNRWTVQIEGALCSDHAWADLKDWPKITEAQYHKRNTWVKPPLAKPVTRDEKIEILKSFKDLLTEKPIHPKAWAYRLQDREKAGEVLSRVQKEAWRTALRSHE